LERLAPIVRGADLAFANLEGPLTQRGKSVEGKTYTFRTPPSRVAMLQKAGFDGFSLANNHIMDFGAVGLEETLAALDGAKICHAGAGANLAAARTPAWFEVQGLPVAFLAYNMTYPHSYWAGPATPGTAIADRDQIVADVKAARARGAQVIVMLHWGDELSDDPRLDQRSLASALAEAGACLVVGAHPHVSQGVQRFRGAIAVYSVGDAVFGGHPLLAKDSLVVRARLNAQGLEHIELLSLRVNRRDTHSRPTIRTDAEAKPRLARVIELSRELGTKLTRTQTAEGWPALTLDLSQPFTKTRVRNAPASATNMK
jgi:poly-gamma-glutamate synthesis protein (capsule biosynthesis protein)